MAPTVSWGEPSRPRAGDTWLWKRTIPDYPNSEGWTPKYAIRGTDALVWDAGWAVAAGEEWTFTIPAASTALTPGTYEWALIVTGSGAYAGRVATVESGVFEVLPNLDTAGPGDRRSHAVKTLEIIEAAIEGRLTSDMEEYVIMGRQVKRIPARDLVRLRGVYRAKVYRERFNRLDVPVKVSL